jgi:integrase
MFYPIFVPFFRQKLERIIERATGTGPRASFPYLVPPPVVRNGMWRNHITVAQRSVYDAAQPTTLAGSDPVWRACGPAKRPCGLWSRSRPVFAALDQKPKEKEHAIGQRAKIRIAEAQALRQDQRTACDYQKARAAEDAAGATVNKEFTVLASILADHGLWNGIRRDAKRLEENGSAGRALLADEEARLLRVAAQVGAKQGHWSPIYTVSVLGLNTGLRHSEVRQLRWANLDLGKHVLVVGQTKSEAGSGRPVPLTEPAWATLDMWASRFPNRKPEDFVFPACENGHVDLARPIANWRTAWHNATSAVECPKCGRLQPPTDSCRNSDCKAKMRGIISPLARLRFHDLRHSAATKMLENGVPIATVAQVLGWSASTAIRMAKRYGHIRPEAQRQALESIATALPEPRPNVRRGGSFGATASQKPSQALGVS